MPKVATPKKAVAKKAIKKAVTKKVASSRKPTLTYAENKHSFWVVDGQILNSLSALKDALSRMDKATFAHHVAKDKNDFAVWVEMILVDKDCAVDVRKAKTIAATKTAVTKHLKKYAL
jgi:hypothetical protein